MLQLQERCDDARRSKGEKWGHGLGQPVMGITKQGVRLTPPKLRLIRKTTGYSVEIEEPYIPLTPFSKGGTKIVPPQQGTGNSKLTTN